MDQSIELIILSVVTRLDKSPLNITGLREVIQFHISQILFLRGFTRD